MNFQEKTEACPAVDQPAADNVPSGGLWSRPSPAADESVFDHLDERILSFYHEALALRRGRLCRPRFALIYPTHVCNHDCVGCDYAERNNQPKPAALSRAEFQNTLDQVIDFGVRGVEFCGGGEPLLHPDIDDAILKLGQRGVSVGLLSNGTVMGPERAELLARVCSYVRISVEAGSPEVFERVKRPKSGSVGFARVIDNLGRLVSIRNQLGTRCQISYKFTVDKNNQGDLENAVQLARTLGTDSIQFKAIRNVPSELDAIEKAAVDRQLDALRVAYPSVRILGNLRACWVRQQCWLSPLHVMIDPSADAFLCCYYRHRLERHRYGNVLETSLRQLWGSPAHRAAIQDVRKHECEKYDCRFVRYAEIMSHALETGYLDFI